MLWLTAALMSIFIGWSFTLTDLCFVPGFQVTGQSLFWPACCNSQQAFCRNTHYNKTVVLSSIYHQFNVSNTHDKLFLVLLLRSQNSCHRRCRNAREQLKTVAHHQTWALQYCHTQTNHCVMFILPHTPILEQTQFVPACSLALRM